MKKFAFASALLIVALSLVVPAPLVLSQGKPAPRKKAASAAPRRKVALIKPLGYPKLVADTKGKVLIVNFWATWCAPCVAEFPEFVALDLKYRTKGVRFVGISADEVTDLQSKVLPFVKAHKVQFDIFVQDVADPQQMMDLVDKQWEGALPATFVYDRQGKLSFVRYGIIDRDQLIQVIENALKT